MSLKLLRSLCGRPFKDSPQAGEQSKGPPSPSDRLASGTGPGNKSSAKHPVNLSILDSSLVCGASPAGNEPEQAAKGARSSETSTNTSDGSEPSSAASTPSTTERQIRSIPESRCLPRYVVERTLGYGGSGKVWLCRRATLGDADLFALKELRRTTSGSTAQRTKKDLLRKVRSEATLREPDPVAGETAASRIPPHPNVLRVYEVVPAGEAENAKVVMEPALGGDVLAVELRPAGVLDEQHLAEIVQGVVQGLAHLHRLGIVHGDLKPGNLLMGGKSNSTVKVADLGCASTFTDPDPSTWWVSAKPSGTPAYMSPEQVAGGAFLGPPADIWSLGACLFQLATGELPFKGQGLMGLFAAITNDPLSDDVLSGLAPELVDLLRAMLDKDPDRRLTLEGVMGHPWLHAHR